MSTWRKVLAVETPNKQFKGYKMDGAKERLPNSAEFSGDKQPSEGNPVKKEQADWKAQQAMFDKNLKREKVPYGSPLMSEKTRVEKYPDTAKDVKPKFANTYVTCPACGNTEDAKTAHKPHVTTSPDLDRVYPKYKCSKCGEHYSRNNGDEFSTGGTKNRQYELDRSIEQQDRRLQEFEKISPSSNWRSTLADLSFQQKPDGTLKIDVVTAPSNPISNAVNTEVQQDQSQVPGQEPVAPPTDVSSVPAEEPAEDESKKKSSLVESNCKESEARVWSIKKEGNLELVGRECEKFAMIQLLDNGQEVGMQKEAKMGHEWRELVNEALWVEKFEDYKRSK